MSREQEFNRNTNPASKFLEWKSSKKAFQYYDKEAGQNVEVKLPVQFAVLKQYKTIKGFNQREQAGITSNEVDDLKKEPLKVGYWKNGQFIEIATGLYADIKEKIAYAGGKFTASVYAVTPKGDLINFQMNGSGLSNWFDLLKKQGRNLLNHYVKVEKTEIGKSGTNEYVMPIYELGDLIKESEMQDLNDKYKEVTDYYRSYSERNRAESEETKSEAKAPENPDMPEADDLPF